MILCSDCLNEIEDCAVVKHLKNYQICDRCEGLYGEVIAEDVVDTFEKRIKDILETNIIYMRELEGHIFNNGKPISTLIRNMEEALIRLEDK